MIHKDYFFQIQHDSPPLFLQQDAKLDYVLRLNPAAQ